jgi:2-(1,2-epoxy-1,2-dihydrophenyl)acetyl-CoA isomerase
VLRKLGRASRRVALAPPFVGALVVLGLAAWAGQRAASDDADLGDLRRAGKEQLEAIYEGFLRVARSPLPTLAAVNGPAVGIGLSLALASDLVVAKESAYFLLAFVNIGLVPDGGSSLLVPSRVGFARAAEMAMLGERIPAPRALEWGLINRVAPDDALQSESDALVERLAAGPTRAYAGAKRQLNAWVFGRMADQLALEASIQQEMAGSGDFAEGVAAFLERRTAVFGGR